jgi:ribonuclease G
LATEIIINVGVYETRIAILEDQKVMEVLVERPEKQRTVGNIYKAIVESVLPGMQAAFVNIGLQKSAFLPLGDVEESRLFDFEVETEKPRAPAFGQHLQQGQEIIVQITKEPIGTKGPRVTTEISLPGRFAVLLPSDDRIGVSRKITNWTEKRRLKKVTQEIKPDGFGIIVRTVAKTKGKAELEGDIKNLLKTWNKVYKRAQKVKAPVLLHREMGMTSSLIRDLFTDDVDRVVVDSKREHKQIVAYLHSVSPQLCSKVELHDEKSPLFDVFKIEQEIEKTWDRRVWLKKGAYLIIDHTEALVTVDVNSGRYVGKTDQGKTALEINLESAREIARQLRLRDIGGIIVIDFIDMASARARKKVWEKLMIALGKDRSRTNALPITEFGLVEMTRQRVRPSLLYTFSETCPVCNGVGRVQGRDTTVSKTERWLKRARAASVEKNLILQVHPLVAEHLSEKDESRLKLLKKSTKTKLDLVSVPELAIEQYRFLSAKTGEDLTEQFKV